MKKLITLFIGIVLGCLPVLSQDTIRSLIITEYRGDNNRNSYVELTNTGQTTLDLSKFRYHLCFWDVNWINWDGIPTVPDWGARFNGVTLSDLQSTLDPGKSIVIKSVFDRARPVNAVDYESWNLPGFLQLDNLIPIHTAEANDLNPFWNRPDLEMHGKDSVDAVQGLGNIWQIGAWASALWYKLSDTDSVLVDQCRMERQVGTNHLINNPVEVAGIANASYTHVLVRKANVTKGNINWLNAKGVDLGNSEWIPIPMFSGNEVYTTVGTHGDYSIDISSQTVVINETESTLTVPWRVRKGDPILKEFNIGPGMGWVYTEDTTSIADSAYSRVQDGDILTFMACGNDLEVKDYTIRVAQPAMNIAIVLPKRRMATREQQAALDFDGQLWRGAPFIVTEDNPVIDSIRLVPFATRVDTLLKYIEKAPNASWEIEWVDGKERADLKFGDKLVVTAEDGTTKKEYFISVLPYNESISETILTNASLSAITWPDIPYFLESWKGDTIPGFNPTTLSYQVTLPYGTENVPAFKATPQNINAKVEEQRAMSLKGAQADRTTTFIVTAEDDTTVRLYTVIFKIELRPQDRQLFVAEPFFSEIVNWGNNSNNVYEIVNVGDVPLDLSRYLIAWDGANPGLAITGIFVGNAISNLQNRYNQAYVPGYKFSDDTTEWTLTPGKLYPDLAVNPIIEPGNVFVLAAPSGQAFRVPQNLRDNWDCVINYHPSWDPNFNTWGATNVWTGAMGAPWDAMYIFRIDNDSILEGKKEVYKDPADYTLIDVVGKPGGFWRDVYIGGRKKSPLPAGAMSFSVQYRLPHIFQPNNDLDTINEQTDWELFYQAELGGQDQCERNVGSHSFDPVTVHLSSISSLLYLVSTGFEGPQSIQGDMAGTTVGDLFGKINKADPGQTITLMNAAGNTKELTDLVLGTDKLKVVSADGKNVTEYSIVNQALDDNAVITTVNSLSKLSIEITGESGLIKGVKYGALLSEMLDSLVIPQTATANILNQHGALVPLKVLNLDTVLVDTRIGDSIYIEVVAQNGKNKITYKFEPDAMSSDAFVISTIFNVDQVKKTISDLDYGLGVRYFWNQIEVVKGATAMLVDKSGSERTSGWLNYDDRLVVVSEDQSTTTVYYLNFLDELNPDIANQAPVVSISGLATATIGSSVQLTGEVTDDGLPQGSTLTYLWEVTSGDAGTVTIATGDQLLTGITFNGLGSFDLRLTVSDGDLSSTAVHSITITPGVGFDRFDMSIISIYPNPAENMVHVTFGAASHLESQIRILDIVGKEAYNGVHFDNKVQINLDNFEAGIYFMIIKVDDQSVITKLNIVK